VVKGQLFEQFFLLLYTWRELLNLCGLVIILFERAQTVVWVPEGVTSWCQIICSKLDLSTGRIMVWRGLSVCPSVRPLTFSLDGVSRTAFMTLTPRSWSQFKVNGHVFSWVRVKGQMSTATW
jgi:hypothetical protein